MFLKKETRPTVLDWLLNLTQLTQSPRLVQFEFRPVEVGSCVGHPPLMLEVEEGMLYRVKITWR